MQSVDLEEICLMLENGIAQLRGDLSDAAAARCLMVMAEIAQRGSLVLSQKQE